jgi:hypothetical protein
MTFTDADRRNDAVARRAETDRDRAERRAAVVKGLQSSVRRARLGGSVGDQYQDERLWDADKRDFVADRRDEIAAERDAIADARDRLADIRENELDERERLMGERLVTPSADGELHRDLPDSAAAAQRNKAREERVRQQAERERAKAARQVAAELRLVRTPLSGLAMAFAEIARYLFEGENFDEVLTRVVETAVHTISGCAMASVTVRASNGHHRTIATSDHVALAVDRAQYESDEGPCLDAVDQPIVHAPALPDPRWPALGSQPVDSGVHAVLSYSLALTDEGTDGFGGGSLNNYATAPEAFDDEAVEIGLVLAAHASVVIKAVRKNEAAEALGRHLHEALKSRDVIGQAKGILMERLHVTPDRAFDLLRRTSQQLNVKLQEIAQRLTETGEFDPECVVER